MCCNFEAYFVEWLFAAFDELTFKIVQIVQTKIYAIKQLINAKKSINIYFINSDMSF